MADVVTIGEILVEIMAEQIGQGFLAPGTWLGPYPSGAPAILADQAARCGASVAMIGAVGDDDFGQLVRERLVGSGVDTGGIATVPVTTGSAFVAYHAGGERDFVYNIANSASGELRPAHVAAAAGAGTFEGCRWLHVMGSSLFGGAVSEAIEDALERARAAGAHVSFDPNVRKELIARPGVREAIARIAAVADLLLLSEDDIAHLAPGLAEHDAAARLLDARATRVVFKRGARGAACHTVGEGVVEQAAFAVEEVDPTGAGDCFGGTFLACLVQGLPPADCLRNATAAGAMAVGRRGPMAGNGSLADIARFLADDPPLARVGDHPPR